MFVWPQNSYAETLTSKGDGIIIADGAFGGDEVMRTGALKNGIRALVKETAQSSAVLLPCGDTTRSLWPEEGHQLPTLAPRPWTSRLQTCEKYLSVVMSHPVCSILL